MPALILKTNKQKTKKKLITDKKTFRKVNHEKNPQSEILIETANSVLSKYISWISVDLNKYIIEIKGKVAYCKKNQTEKYRVGISFEGTRNKIFILLKNW